MNPLPPDGSLDRSPGDSVGFVGPDAGVRVLLPPCYPPEARRAPSLDQGIQLFRVLRRYRQLGRGRAAVKAQPGPRYAGGPIQPVGRLVHAIEAGLSLAEDYAGRGLLQFQEPRVDTGPVGRTDWPRTLHRALPTPVARSVIYVRPYHRHLVWRNDHPLTVLHAAAVLEVFERFFGHRPPDLYVEPPPTRSARRELGAVLSRYRGRLYQERQLSVLSMIEAYWGDPLYATPSARVEWEYTEKFEVVWEQMCRTVIGGTPFAVPAWPSGRYVSRGGRATEPGLRLVTDFVRRAGERVIVFDAKFYTSGALPDTYSVLKQLAYGFFLSREWHEGGSDPGRITQVFLLPRYSAANGGLARLWGRHVLSPSGRSTVMAAPIYLVELDYEAVANAYLTHRTIPIDTVLQVVDEWTDDEVSPSNGTA